MGRSASPAAVSGPDTPTAPARIQRVHPVCAAAALPGVCSEMVVTDVGGTGGYQRRPGIARSAAVAPAKVTGRRIQRGYLFAADVDHAVGYPRTHSYRRPGVESL